MATMFLRRAGNALVPDGDESITALMALPFGKPFKAEVKQARNLQQHKLYWTLCHRIGGAIGINPDSVSDLLKIETGHCDTITSKKYGAVHLPRSISFAKMDQTEFATFFEACVRIIYENWSIERADVISAVSDLLEPKAEKRQ